MTRSALSERLNNPDNWKGTDDDVWYMRWRIKFKYLLAFGPRATEWWAKWREFPKTLFAIRSKHGEFRIETESWERDSSIESTGLRRVVINDDMHVLSVGSFGGMPIVKIESGYLSRVQYYTRWHFQLQWPFMIAFHWYWRAADVPKYGEPRPDTDGRLVFCYLGAHRDADKVYWFPSAYLGLNWK